MLSKLALTLQNITETGIWVQAVGQSKAHTSSAMQRAAAKAALFLCLSGSMSGTARAFKGKFFSGVGGFEVQV